MRWIILAALLIPLLTVPTTPRAEQVARQGLPLEIFCNTVPDLTVKRTDSVDNWVRICTVWLSAKCQASTPPLEELKARQRDTSGGGR